MLSWSYRLRSDGVVRFIYSSFILKLSITFSNAGDWLVSSFEWTQLCLTRKRKVKNNMEKCFLLLLHTGAKRNGNERILREFLFEYVSLLLLTQPTAEVMLECFVFGIRLEKFYLESIKIRKVWLRCYRKRKKQNFGTYQMTILTNIKKENILCCWIKMEGTKTPCVFLDAKGT